MNEYEVFGKKRKKNWTEIGPVQTPEKLTCALRRKLSDTSKCVNLTHSVMCNVSIVTDLIKVKQKSG